MSTQDYTTIVDKAFYLIPKSEGIPSLNGVTVTPQAVVKTALDASLLPNAGAQNVATAVANMVGVNFNHLTQPQREHLITTLSQGASNGTSPATLAVNAVAGLVGFDPTALSANQKNAVTQALGAVGLTLPATGPLKSITAGSVGGTLNTLPEKWGVYDSNSKLAIDADTVSALGVTGSSKIATHQVQNGAFVSYNKVQEPLKITLKLAKSGNKDNGKQLRTDFLNTLQALKQGLDLLQVITPNAIYASLNLTGYNYRFESGSAVSMIVAEVTLEEVRQVKAQYSTTDTAKNPDGTPAINTPKSVNAASPQSGGLVAPQAATPAQQSLWQQTKQFWGF